MGRYQASGTVPKQQQLDDKECCNPGMALSAERRLVASSDSRKCTLKPLSEFGHVAHNKGCWYARIQRHVYAACGPAHKTRAAAQSDLDAARQCTSVIDMCVVLTSLRLDANAERNAERIRSIQAENGSIQRNGNGWRVQVDLGVGDVKRMIYGPQRATQVAAQADLDEARKCATRFDMASFLEYRCSTSNEIVSSKEGGQGKRWAEPGKVQKVYNGWKAVISVDKQTLDSFGAALPGCGRRDTAGPLRSTRAAAQADLDAARQCTSGFEMCWYLVSLVIDTKKDRSSQFKVPHRRKVRDTVEQEEWKGAFKRLQRRVTDLTSKCQKLQEDRCAEVERHRLMLEAERQHRLELQRSASSSIHCFTGCNAKLAQSSSTSDSRKRALEPLSDSEYAIKLERTCARCWSMRTPRRCYGTSPPTHKNPAAVHSILQTA